MPTIQYITKTLAKDGITVTPDTTTPNFWIAQYKGYTLNFSANPGDSSVCAMSAERTGVKDPSRIYRDTLKGLLRTVDTLAANMEANPFLALGSPILTQREMLENLKSDAGQIELDYPTGSAVIVDTTEGPKAGISKGGWIMAEKFTAALVVEFSDAGPLTIPTGLLYTVKLAPVQESEVLPAAPVADEAAETPLLSFRCVALNGSGEIVLSGSGWDWNTAYNNFLNTGKPETLSGDLAASVVAVGIITIKHYSDGTTLEGQPETNEHFLRAFSQKVAGKVEAYRELARALAAAAANPDHANLTFLREASEQYSAAYWQGIPSPQ